MKREQRTRDEPLIRDGEDSKEDSYGSDDPRHQNPSQELDSLMPRQDGEVDGAPQGFPKGYKRSRLNSAGQGAPVQVKPEKILSPSYGTQTGAPSCSFPSITTISLISNPIYPRFHCLRPTPTYDSVRAHISI